MKKIFLIIVLLMSNPCFANAQWECISSALLVCHTWRLYVPPGWIVSGDNQNETYAMTFVPDPEHIWKK